MLCERITFFRRPLESPMEHLVAICEQRFHHWLQILRKMRIQTYSLGQFKDALDQVLRLPTSFVNKVAVPLVLRCAFPACMWVCIVRWIIILKMFFSYRCKGSAEN